MHNHAATAPATPATQQQQQQQRQQSRLRAMQSCWQQLLLHLRFLHGLTTASAPEQLLDLSAVAASMWLMLHLRGSALPSCAL
jgi:hypothetical protein